MVQPEKINIAMLGTFPPARGGIATNIRNLLKSPLSKKYRFLKYQTMSKKQGTPLYFKEKMHTRIMRVILNLVYFIFYLQRNSFQLVHLNSSLNKWAFWRDASYLLICKMWHKKVFLQLHGGKLDEFCRDKTAITRALIKWLLTLPDQVGVCSNTQKQPFSKIGLDAKVNVLPNMVTLNKFRNNGDYRQTFQIQRDFLAVLFIAAHFNRQKGIRELLAAIPLILERHKKTSFILVGSGGEEESVRTFIQQNKMHTYVTLTGLLPPGAIEQLLVSSDIFVLPSYSEGLPMTILEAMAAGLPIVATPVGAIPDIIKNGENGFLVKPQDHISLAEMIMRLIENKELRINMGQHNINLIKEKYETTAAAKIYDSIYQSLL